MGSREKLSRRLALCVALLWPAAGAAKEADSFTHRFEALAFPEGEADGRAVSDFTAEFNGHFRQIFGELLVELNEENKYRGESCRTDRARRRLFHKASNRLGGPLLVTRNRLRPAINAEPNLLRTEMRDSIYRDFSPWRSISLGLATKLGTKLASLFRFDLERVLVADGGTIARAPDGRLAVLGPEGVRTAAVFRLRDASPAILRHEGRTYFLLEDGQALTEAAGEIRRVTPILVSSDKFSHFFNRSLGLFKRLGAGSAEDLDRVVARNNWLEDSLFGSKSTGMAAYSDLVANFQGMRFWIHLLGTGMDGRPLADPLADGPRRPILECSPEGQWVQTRAVDISEYLDPAWDEALNCNRMRSRVLLEQVVRRIEDLNRQADGQRAYRCPVDTGLIAETAARYGRFSEQMINAVGHTTLRSRGD